MKIRRKSKQKIGYCLSVAAIASQTVLCSAVQAKELEYEGTTQIAADDYYLDVDTFAAELEVEEVYVEAGNNVAEGDPILKLTEESYSDAAAYYAAAILKAENNLADVQLSYDQGLLEAQYTYETAEAKADTAELVREYQQEELERTIEDHEEVLEELTERIAELENGIANGSYETGGSSGSSGVSGSSGGSGGGSASSDSGADKSGSSDEKNMPSETDETQKMPETEAQDTNASETPQTETDTGESAGTQETDAAETELPQTETQDRPVDSTESGETGEATDPAENGEPSGTPETEPGTSEKPGEGGGQEEVDTALLTTQIEEKNAQYDEVLKQIEALLAGTESGTEPGGDADTGATSGEGTGGLDEQLKSSIDGDTDVKTNLENVQKNLDTVPEAVLEIVKAAYPDYEEYIKLLDNCIRQLETDIETQEKVKAALDGQSAGTDTDTDIDESALQGLLVQLQQIGTERSALYTSLIALQQEQIKTLQETVEAGTDEKPGTEQQPDTGTNTQGGQQPGTESSTQGGQQPGADSNTQTGQRPGNSGTDQQGSDGQQGEEGQTEGENSISNMTGSFAAGSMSGGSQSAFGGTLGGGSTESASAGTQTGSDSVSQMSGNMGMSADDISLFGSTYDLTQVKNLLEREPSDSDNAQELLEQLEDSLETVQEQYAKLTREKKITELEIQYTYDTSILSGKLAEFTYQAEVQEWEETLAEAKSEKTDLEAEKAILDSMEDGILCADRDGLAASVGYEAGDTVSSAQPVISYYDTSAVTIAIEVSQEDIAEISVGDTVDVTVNQFMELEGTVSEKAVEPQSGTSRTTVNYEVQVKVDNADGRLSSGLTATVAVVQEDTQKTMEGQESGDEEKEE